MCKKRILFIGSYPNPIDKYLYVFFKNLIHAMADSGVECHIISPVSVTKYRKKIKDIPFYKKEKTENGKSVFVYYPKYISASEKKIGIFNTSHITTFFFKQAAYRVAKSLKIKFDAVYGHFFLRGGLSAIYLGNKFNIPSYVAYGECDYKSQVQERHGDLKRKDIVGVTGIISVSSKNTLELRKIKLFDDIPILTCPNALDLSLFNRITKDESRKMFSIPTDDFVVGFVGGFIERKGDKRLLQACKDIKGVSLAFAGKGDCPPSGDNVVFCGPVSHEDIGDFLSALDVFALPTLNEGCCNAILEAMAAGVAIISSDLSFNDDILDETNSIRVNPNDIGQIKQAVIELKNNPVRLRSISDKAKLDSLKFTIEKRADKIYDFIEKTSKCFDKKD